MKKPRRIPRYTELPRSTKPIARSTSPLPRGGIRRKARRPSEYARIYGSKSRVSWIKHLPCLCCVAISPFFGRTDGSSHNAHTETGGTGRKAGHETIVPLCHSHHRRYDDYKKPFDTDEARQAMKDAAVIIAAAWLDHLTAHQGTAA